MSDVGMKLKRVVTVSFLFVPVDSDKSVLDGGGSIYGAVEDRLNPLSRRMNENVEEDHRWKLGKLAHI